MGKRLVITEKPSVARDIAAALGGFAAEDDEALESEDFVITWAVGHLLELSEPADYDPVYKSWEIKHLPILPTEFQIKPREGQKKRLDKIKKLGTRTDVEGVVNACDAGREGELIYRRIAEFCSLEGKPQQRLWLQSMTPQSIRDAFQALRPGADLDSLADAAWLRSVGDWLVGMNATRALTQRLKSRGEREAWSAGRVQTPTLFILVAREREILAHVPQDYWEILGTFAQGDPAIQQWDARYWDPKAGTDEEGDEGVRKPNRIFDRAEVDRIVAMLEATKVGSASEKRKKSKQSPPLLFDLTTLQREANRRFSMSARRTLDAAQRLYEAHKILTYPRTDSRYLPGDYGPVVDTLLGSLTGISGSDWVDIARISTDVQKAGPQNLNKLLDQSKVRDHFAIVPTGNPVPPLSGDDLRIFDLVVRQFLAALMGPATFATIERIVEIGDPAGAGKAAKFRATARMLEIPGYLEALGQIAGSGTSMPPLVPGQDEVTGVPVALDTFAVEDKETRPASRYSEAQLLRMMETAGERVEVDDLSDAMKDRGLGTPATRADTIERLVSTGYSRRVAGKLYPASKAMKLMDVLERVNAKGLASPALTGEWEYALNQVALGNRKRNDVRDALISYTRDVTNSLKGFEYDDLYKGEPSLGICPACGSDVIESVWGYRCVKNNPPERVCEFILWKDRFGRYIDRSLAERLLRERTVGPIDGFIDRSGREVIKGTLSLKRDEEKGAWVLDTKFGAPAAAGEGEEGAEQIIGPSFPCPAHPDCEIIETTHRWVCKKVMDGTERSGPLLPKKVCQRDIEPEEAATYFGAEAKTPLLEGFTSKRGRPFRGMLIRKPTGKHGFEFPERPGVEGKKGPPARGRRGKGKDADEVEETAKPKKKAAAKSTAKKPAAKKKAPKTDAVAETAVAAAEAAPKAARKAPAKTKGKATATGKAKPAAAAEASAAVPPADAAPPAPKKKKKPAAPGKTIARNKTAAPAVAKAPAAKTGGRRKMAKDDSDPKVPSP